MSAIVEQALGLSYGATKGEDNWNVWMDSNLVKIGAVAQISVASMSENTPPGTFVEGRRAVVGSSPTGAYAGQAGKLAVGVEGVYVFYTVLIGWNIFDEVNKTLYTWNGTSYEAQSKVAKTITETGTARTLSLSDAFGYIRTTNSGAVTITVPTDASVAFPIDTEITVFQSGAGTVTFAAAVGVTIEADSLSISGQKKAATLKKVDTNTWDLIGALA